MQATILFSHLQDSLQCNLRLPDILQALAHGCPLCSLPSVDAVLNLLSMQASLALTSTETLLLAVPMFADDRPLLEAVAMLLKPAFALAGVPSSSIGSCQVVS